MPRGCPAKLSDEEKQRIKAMRGCGLTVEEIASIHNISKTTLYKLCADELDQGKASGKLLVANKLMDAIKKGNVTAMIFYLKTQGEWREVQRIESVAEVHHKGIIKEEPLSDAEWERTFGAGADADGMGSAGGTPTRSH